jgi:hypothetical protein
MNGPNHVLTRCANPDCARQEFHLISSIKRMEGKQSSLKLICMRCLKDKTIIMEWENKKENK